MTLTTCTSDYSVCNILTKNDTDKLTKLRQVCSCSDGKICPAVVDEDAVAIFIQGKWLITCSQVDLLPVCQPGQVSLQAISKGTHDEANFKVLCACPREHDTDGAQRTLEGGKVKVEIYCKAEQTDTAEGFPNIRDSFALEALSLPAEGDIYGNLEAQNEKRNKGESAFYKRNGINRNINGFYKRGPADMSAFYKRGIDSSSSFYKRAPFYKRQPVISKRSVRELSAFYKRTPVDDVSTTFDVDDENDSSLDFDKKGFDLNTFYKRAGYGMSSFYKRAPGDSSFTDIDDPENDNLEMTPEENYLDTVSLEKKSRGKSSFYKRSLFNLYKPRPLFRNLGTSSLYKDRGLGAGNSAFYGGDEGAEQRSFGQRGIDGDYSAFNKRSRHNSGISNFYKRDFSDMSGRFGLSSFYKRDLADRDGSFGLSSFYKRDSGDRDSRFYKKSSELVPAMFSDDQDSSDHLNGLRKRNVVAGDRGINVHRRSIRSVSSFYKRGLNDFNGFYKRAPNDNSISSFYKRNPNDNSISSFYKRAPNDNSVSSFYKRAPSDYSSSSFYKRSPNDNSISSFYKRAPNDYSISSFYKRANAGTSSFYKRGLSGLSAFYKRGTNDRSAFYKRGKNDHSAFYKRGINDHNAFYKRTPASDDTDQFDKRFNNGLNGFYKRSAKDLSAFYKRSPNDLSSFYKRSIEGLEDFLNRWRENDLSRLYNGNDDVKEDNKYSIPLSRR